MSLCLQRRSISEQTVFHSLFSESESTKNKESDKFNTQMMAQYGRIEDMALLLSDVSPRHNRFPT